MPHTTPLSTPTTLCSANGAPSSTTRPPSLNNPSWTTTRTATSRHIAPRHRLDYHSSVVDSFLLGRYQQRRLSTTRRLTQVPSEINRLGQQRQPPALQSTHPSPGLRALLRKFAQLLVYLDTHTTKVFLESEKGTKYERIIKVLNTPPRLLGFLALLPQPSTP